MTPKPVRHAAGNAMFIILIAIVLFAALSYSVTRSSRVSGNMSQEEIVFASNAIMRYGADMRAAVERVVSGGTPFTLLSFDNAVVGGYAIGGQADINRVFHPSGGGMTYMAPETAWLDQSQAARARFGEWYFPPKVCVPAIGTGSAVCTNANYDIVMTLPYVRQEICDFINQKLNNGCGGGCSDADEPWPEGDIAFVGAFAAHGAPPASEFIGVNGGAFSGRAEGCAQGAGASAQPAGTFFYYKVLADR